MGVHQTDGHAGVAGKGRVHGVVREHLAEHAVGRVGRDGADGVARVDQLDVGPRDAPFQLGLQPGPDVGEDRVARGVALDVCRPSRRGSSAAEEVLSGALGDADDGVALSLDELGEVGDETACFFFFFWFSGDDCFEKKNVRKNVSFFFFFFSTLPRKKKTERKRKTAHLSLPARRAPPGSGTRPRPQKTAKPASR